jgi:hypothetical protein
VKYCRRFCARNHNRHQRLARIRVRPIRPRVRCAPFTG